MISNHCISGKQKSLWVINCLRLAFHTADSGKLFGLFHFLVGESLFCRYTRLLEVEMARPFSQKTNLELSPY